MNKVDEKELVDLTKFLNERLAGKKFALIIKYSDGITVNAGNCTPLAMLQLTMQASIALHKTIDKMGGPCGKPDCTICKGVKN